MLHSHADEPLKFFLTRSKYDEGDGDDEDANDFNNNDGGGGDMSDHDYAVDDIDRIGDGYDDRSDKDGFDENDYGGTIMVIIAMMVVVGIMEWQRWYNDEK